MQQRRLRLGDILDDYCPRERRITNHTVVAMVEDQVKHTRCSTCDADHEYKEARVPVRRRKDAGALLGEAGAAGPLRRVAAAGPEHVADDVSDEIIENLDVPPVAVGTAALDDTLPLLDDQLVDDQDDEDVPEREHGGQDEGPVHRRLIRATLPRPEGQAPEWKEPEFTIRQPGGGRGGGNVDGNRNGHRNGNGGGRNGRRPVRAQGGSPGQGQGHHGSGGRFSGSRQGGPGNSRPGSGQGQGNNANGHRGGGRPNQPGQNRGPRPAGQGRKRGR